MLEKVKEYFEDNYSMKGVRIVDTKTRVGKKDFSEDKLHVITTPTFYDIYFEYKEKRYVVSFTDKQDIDVKFKQRLEDLKLDI